MKNDYMGSIWARMRSWWEHGVVFEPKDWVQVEVTSACNAACAYCPRTVYRGNWHDRFMPMETFQRLLPALRKTSLAYLQGWGEPFLHPDFPVMVRLAKHAGCTVGATSNGMLLTPERIRRVMDAGLDILALSLAGTTSAVNDAARAGTSLAKVLENAALVQKIKAKQRSSTPVLHFAYMLLRSGLQDLRGLPQLMADHGVHEAVVSVLDFEPGEELSSEVVAPRNKDEQRELDALFTEVRDLAKDLGLTIHLPGFGAKDEEALVCSENIERALFVSADGEVSPCVYANVPVDRVEYARQGRAAFYHRVTFGNVATEILPKIWRKADYVRFREQLVQGNPAEICRNCPKRAR